MAQGSGFLVIQRKKIVSSGVSLITVHAAYASTNKNKIVRMETRRMFTCVHASTLPCFHSLCKYSNVSQRRETYKVDCGRRMRGDKCKCPFNSIYNLQQSLQEGYRKARLGACVYHAHTSHRSHHPPPIAILFTNVTINGTDFELDRTRTYGENNATCNRMLALSPFLIGRMFVREPSWKYLANLVGS